MKTKEGDLIISNKQNEFLEESPKQITSKLAEMTNQKTEPSKK
jgi:hypothetical protein